MIAIISSADDLHAHAVSDHLDAAGVPWFLLDTGEFPVRSHVAISQDGSRHEARWTDPTGTVHDLHDVSAVWWRRPQPFTLDTALEAPDDWTFAFRECDAAIRGLWTSMTATWVNDPDRDERASRKVAQLRAAADIGLTVPRTCITSDPGTARAFLARESAGVVYKPFGGTEQVWRETRVLGDADAALLDRVALAPVIFQQLIDGGRDVRITIVGRQVFAALIDASKSNYPFDFRMDIGNAPIRPIDLPEPVHERLLRLMDHWGLEYAAIDMRIDSDGDFVFLEVNPAGQWLFIEVATGQPMAAALADHLAALASRGVPQVKPLARRG